MAASQPGPRFTGWWKNPSPVSSGAGQGSTLSYYINGTKIMDITSAGGSVTGTQTVSGALTSTAGPITATAGNIIATAGDLRATAGNARLGVVSAFGTTEPTSALVMKQGTAFAGAIATSGGLMSNGTVLRKIIADGTVSNVET